MKTKAPKWIMAAFFMVAVLHIADSRLLAGDNHQDGLRENGTNAEPTPIVPGSSVWPSQYKIKPWETDRLRDGDVVGPDGIVYPDWRRCGVPGGIPDLSRQDVRSQYKEFPVPIGANDAAVAAVVKQALAHAKSGGKALVQLAAGTYKLSAPLPKLDASDIVVAGAGMDKTVIELSGKKTGALFSTGPKNPCANPYFEIGQAVTRGSTTLPVASSKGISVGDIVYLMTHVPNELPPESTMRRRYDWPESKTFYTNQYNNHFGRGMLARVAAVADTAITLDRPVAHDFHADEPIQLRKTSLASGIGIQDLTIITGAPGTKLDPIYWENIADSWLLRVAIRKPANWALGYGSNFRLNCEIRDCVFDGTQEDINRGSTAYLGWSGTVTDCLMIGTKANDLRHMGIFQGAIRCVIRDCVFTGKTVRSPQFHGQLPHDNLIEGTTFDVQSEVWTVDGMASLRHGVEGPRNVLYNCRFPTSQGSAVFFGGVEAHILAYNRWPMGGNEHWRGSPIMAYDRTWDTIVVGNVMQADPRYPFASLNDLSCVGWEIRGNTVHGSNGIVAMGDGQVAVNDGNRVLPLDAPMAEPRPEAKSIIDWQRANADKPRLVVMPVDKSVLAPGESAKLRVTRVKADKTADLAVRLRATPSGIVNIPATATIPAGAAFADVVVRHGGGAAGEATVTAEADGLLGDPERLTVLDAAPKPSEWLQPDGERRAEGLPQGWRLTDFGRAAGNDAPATSAKWEDGRLTLRGGGIACNTDRNIHLKFRGQVWQVLNGDGSITAKLESASANAQTGLIIADDAAPITECTVLLADGAVLSTGAGNETTAQVGNARKSDGFKAPVWLRLTRKGGIFTAHRATAENPTDADWQELAKVDVYADPPKGQEHYRSQAKWDKRVHVGILLNSAKSGEAAEAVYSGIKIGNAIP